MPALRPVLRRRVNLLSREWHGRPARVATLLAQPALVASAPVGFPEWLPSFLSDGPPPGKKARAAPFPLGEALTPVPGRLVDKILEGEFVDFSELLPDNVELRRREAERGIAAGWFTPSTPMRRLTSLLSWVQAFAAFAAVTLSSQPQRSTELMAYLRLLVGEAQRRGGSGWLEYDRQFRAQAAENPTKAWSKLDLLALFLNSFLAEKYRPARAPPSCEYCLEADHATEDCALAPTSEVVYCKSKEKVAMTTAAPRVQGRGVISARQRNTRMWFGAISRTKWRRAL